jgi:fatty acid desaturase
MDSVQESLISEEELTRYAQQLRKDQSLAEAVRKYDAASRKKVYLLNASFLATFAAWIASGGAAWLIAPLIIVNGMFALPYLRVFIHSEAHWGLGVNRAQTWYLRYLAFAAYQVPFEAYRLGHFAHHKYDNDVPTRGLANDRQSTYLYSRSGNPISFLIWALHYLLVYQYFYQFMLVIRKASRQKMQELAVQALIIVALDLGLALISLSFFLEIFVPSLSIAWLGSSVVLYMMHNVRKSDAVYHHSVNSYSRAFNKFGDNDGLHIVHSMFPFLHPYHVTAVDEMLRKDLHPSQVIEGHYVTGYFKQLLTPKRRYAVV